MSNLLWLLSPVLLALLARTHTTASAVAEPGNNWAPAGANRSGAARAPAAAGCAERANVESSSSAQIYVYLSPFWYTFMAAITAIGLLVSLISNMIIIYLFACTPSLRNNPSNIVAVNLSLSDLLYCIQWPSVIYCSITQTTWMLKSEFVCKSFGFITLSTALASIITVLVMSIERLFVISNPIKAKLSFTNRTAYLVTLMIWIVALSTAFPPLFGKLNRYTLDPSKTSCTLDYLSHKTHYKLYILFLYVLYWILPAIIITICYLMIIRAFKRSSLSVREAGDGGGGGGCNTQRTSAHLAHLQTRPVFSRRTGAPMAAPASAASSTQTPTLTPPPPIAATSKYQMRSLNLYCAPATTTTTLPLGARVVGGGVAPTGRLWGGLALEPVQKCFGAFQNRSLIMRNEPANRASERATDSTSADNNHHNNEPSPPTPTSAGAPSCACKCAAARTATTPTTTVDCTCAPLLGPVGSICVGSADGPNGIDRYRAAKKVHPTPTLTRRCGGAAAAAAGQVSSAEWYYLWRAQLATNGAADSAAPFVARPKRRRQRQVNVARQPPPPQQTSAHWAPDKQVAAAAPALGSDRHPTMTKTWRKSSLNMTNSVSRSCHLACRSSAPSCGAHVVVERCDANLVAAAAADAAADSPDRQSCGRGRNHRTCFRPPLAAVASLSLSSSSAAAAAAATGNKPIGVGEKLSTLSLPAQTFPLAQRTTLSTVVSRNAQPVAKSRPEQVASCTATARQVTHFRLAKMSFYLILLWLVSWTPIASLAMVNSVRECHHASVTAVFLAHTMTKLGPTFDVFIYGISHPKIKSKFRQIVKWLFTFGKMASRRAEPRLDFAGRKSERCAGATRSSLEKDRNGVVWRKLVHSLRRVSAPLGSETDPTYDSDSDSDLDRAERSACTGTGPKWAQDERASEATHAKEWAAPS